MPSLDKFRGLCLLAVLLIPLSFLYYSRSYAVRTIDGIGVHRSEKDREVCNAYFPCTIQTLNGFTIQCGWSFAYHLFAWSGLFLYLLSTLILFADGVNTRKAGLYLNMISILLIIVLFSKVIALNFSSTCSHLMEAYGSAVSNCTDKYPIFVLSEMLVIVMYLAFMFYKDYKEIASLEKKIQKSEFTEVVKKEVFYLSNRSFTLKLWIDSTYAENIRESKMQTFQTAYDGNWRVSDLEFTEVRITENIETIYWKCSVKTSKESKAWTYKCESRFDKATKLCVYSQYYVGWQPPKLDLQPLNAPLMCQCSYGKPNGGYVDCIDCMFSADPEKKKRCEFCKGVGYCWVPGKRCEIHGK